MKIIFAGTTDFAVHHLRLVHESPHEVSMVLTQPDRKSGRGRSLKPTPVKVFSEKNSLELCLPINLKNNLEVIEKVKSVKADLLLVVAYGQIIPKEILGLTKKGFINIHASLLPKWRGAAPIQRSIMNLDKETGISIMKINDKLDAGPVCSSFKTEINANPKQEAMQTQLTKCSMRLV